MPVRIVEVPIPAAPGAEGWELFAAVCEVSSAVEVAAYGTPELAESAEEVLPHWHDPEQVKHLFAAVDGGRVVGRLAAWTPNEAPDKASSFVQVLPAAQGRGIGSLLHARLLELATRQGWSRAVTWAAASEAPGERLAPPTGFGSVPRDARGTRFLLDRGWRLEQVERCSRFALPADADRLARLRADAETRSDGYRIHTWTGFTPEPLRGGMAQLMERMTTDAPSAGLEEPAESWDADRILDNDRRLADSPTTMLTSAVEHVATGRLAGMTRLRVHDDPTRPAFQWDTIVRREDRGHRLGMLLKIVNLQALEERMPGRPSVITWNAEENRHMLDVNEALGFVPIGYEGAWRKDLT
ncbi:GNAT family N-acetyltransferase [Pseudolysinimonas sp.]|uniref:GNAT family N-acetyltransferase n=1 Tax=Pseudolysinimonas sp. TaxID=2680009 RepID=UPI003F80B868